MQRINYADAFVKRSYKNDNEDDDDGDESFVVFFRNDPQTPHGRKIRSCSKYSLTCKVLLHHI